MERIETGHEPRLTLRPASGQSGSGRSSPASTA